MRRDMFKVIVERPRSGGRWRPFPRHEKAYLLNEIGGMRRVHRAPKYLNENLAPLVRFLGSRVGKHWNKVYAEICEHLRSDSAVQQHVRDHLGDIVALHTEKRADGIYLKPVEGGFFAAGPIAESRWEFYVHPISGVLMRNRHRRSWSRRWSKQRAQEAAEIATWRRDISPTLQLHKLAGCWFEVTLAPLAPGDVLPPGERDAVTRTGLAARSPQALYGRTGVYARSKRQLSKRELNERQLRND